jgi:group I intron endonuclease
METIIYTLSDDSGVRYIGKTINLKKRYQSHINESSLRRTHKEKWINKTISEGGKITMEVLDFCDEKESNQIESYWISQFRAWGFNLVNLTLGGDGGSPMLGKHHSEYTKSKMSETQKKLNRNFGGWNKGLNMSDNFKKKISEASKGRIVSDETKEKISKNTKGKKKKPMSKKTKLKISEKKKGMISPNKGKKYSDEVKLKMSLSKLGVKRDENTRKTLSECKKIIWVIKKPNGEIVEFIGYDSFKEYVKKNSLDVSVTTLKSYGKNKGWEIINKLKIT